MSADITRFSGDEGRQRELSPSMNAPHSYVEALIACLMSARTQMTRPTGINHGLAPDATPQQREFMRRAYDDAQVMISALIEDAQEQYRRGER